MIENIALTELIDRYLGGELKPEEKTAFERRLATEPALSEQVTLHRQITASVKSSGRAGLLAMLEEEDAKMPAYQEVAVAEKPEAKVIPFAGRSKQMYYWAAAAVLLLLVPFIFIIRNTTSADKIFANYFKPHEYQGVPVSGDTADLSTKAMNHYEEGKYALALPILEKMLGNKAAAAEAEVQFYKGNSHLALNHAKDAVACFEAVIAMPANQYTEEAQWYLALSYIKADNKAKAKELLNTIVDTQNHPFHKDASELLKKL
jgi:hypothetical protein